MPGIGPFTKVLDTFREKFQVLPFTGDEFIAKGFALLLLMFPSFLSPGQSDRRTHWKWPLIGLGTGLLLFFGTAGLTPVEADPTQAWSYLVITSLGYLLVTYGIGGLSAYYGYSRYLKKFRRDTGFDQEQRLIETENSLNFRATYQYNGRKRKSWINIINPRRGVLIMGSPGAGKSWFLIEPMIEQLVAQNRALFVYDFKYPVLTQFTYGQFLKHQKHYPPGAKFFCINFTDLARSHRCNLIDPATMANKSDALGISRTILYSINRSWASKQGEFFVESPINYLAALIWFLRTYKKGIHCTLPHVIELSKATYEELFTLLNAEPETRGLIGPFKEAYLNKTTEMLDGQVASARIPLNRLDSPDLYYVLSGNDLKLDINDPRMPADEDDRQPLPVVAAVTEEIVKENFDRIGREIETLVKTEMTRILEDPELRRFIVRR